MAAVFLEVDDDPVHGLAGDAFELGDDSDPIAVFEACGDSVFMLEVEREHGDAGFRGASMASMERLGGGQVWSSFQIYEIGENDQRIQRRVFLSLMLNVSESRNI